MDELKVFLSSPDDVKDDKDKLEKFLETFSEHTIKKHEIRVVPLTGEKAQRGVTRPQKAINTLLMECDLYIGLIWKRFGSPTGVSPSGTQEEFTIATNSYEQNKRPQIQIFFKDVNEADIPEKNKSQFRKVMDFKENIKKNVYYYSYPDISFVIEELKKKLDSIMAKLPIIDRFEASSLAIKKGEQIKFFYNVKKTELPLILERSYVDGTDKSEYNLKFNEGHWTDLTVIKDSTYKLVSSNNYGKRSREIKIKVIK
jgi:hypothetical protein